MEAEKENIAKVEAKLGHVFTPEKADDGHKMNYVVPNFGPDPDMIGTARSIAGAQNELGAWNPTQDENGFWNVPSTMVQVESDPIVSSLGKITQYKYPDLPDDPWAPAKINYPVPSYGADPDMVGTLNSISIGEKMNNHKFIMGTADSKAKWHNVAKDTLYDYHPKLDGDVIVTNRNIGAAEDALGYTYGGSQ